MSTFMAYCDGCRRVHAFPRQQAEPYRVNRVNLALSVIAYFVAALFGLLVVGGLFAWWVTA